MIDVLESIKLQEKTKTKEEKEINNQSIIKCIILIAILIFLIPLMKLATKSI
ncbi:hypothetical protein HN587_05745 [Candidatus Woesearchaeota archaeon]|jgi:hypothetical protein|nr:hypothetical protein [Candidatus Woesearchaeota archaeon]